MVNNHGLICVAHRARRVASESTCAGPELNNQTAVRTVFDVIVNVSPAVRSEPEHSTPLVADPKHQEMKVYPGRINVDGTAATVTVVPIAKVAGAGTTPGVPPLGSYDNVTCPGVAGVDGGVTVDEGGGVTGLDG